MDSNSPAIIEAVQHLFDQFGSIDQMTPMERNAHLEYEEYFIRDAETCIKWSDYTNKRSMLYIVVSNLESKTFLNKDIDVDFDLSGKRKYLKNVKYRLSESLLNQIERIVRQSTDYIIYPCNEGSNIRGSYSSLDSPTNSFPYSRQLLIGDTFAVYSVEHFPFE